MIEKLVIHRFRGIRQGVLDDFSQINLLVGPNNSGKSAVLEMLYLAGVSGQPCGFLSEELGDRIDSETHVPPVFEAHVPLVADFLGYRPFSRLWQRHGLPGVWADAPGGVTPDNSLIYRLKYLPENHPLRLFKLIPPPSDAIETYGGFSREDLETIALFTMLVPEDLPAELLPEIIEAEASLEPGKSHLAYGWHPDFVFKGEQRAKDWQTQIAVWATQGALPTPNRVLFFDFHLAYSHFHKSFFDFVHQIPDWYEKIAEAMAKIFPEELNGCRVAIIPVESGGEGRHMTGTVSRPGQPPLPIDAFGDGARHAFKVLAGLLALTETMSDEDTAFFLWEDPELFMHPTALGELLEVVMDLVKDKPVQIFMTTQSIEVLAYIAQMMQKDTLPEELVRTYTLSLEAGQLETRMYWGTTLNDWLENEFDPRWFGNEQVKQPPLTWHLKDDEGVEL